jgi:hypothetical protein
MKKIHLQNLIAICDLAVQKGLIHPDDLINVGFSRKAAIDLAAQLSDEQSLIPEAKDEQPSEAKAKK